jgi:hypothetical protein
MDVRTFGPDTINQEMEKRQEEISDGTSTRAG